MSAKPLTAHRSIDRRIWLGASIKRKLTLREASAERRDYLARLVRAISGPWLPGGAAGRAP